MAAYPCISAGFSYLWPQPVLKRAAWKLPVLTLEQVFLVSPWAMGGMVISIPGNCLQVRACKESPVHSIAAAGTG